ncbi:MAG: 2-oxoisovalerate dehydrogenase [Chloroflexi bacterium]|nr:2-oxoisovalerate dehydrogenase [Chloroflexota bacterium]
MSEIIFEVQEAPEGGYTARALGHAIFTEADTYEDLREMARDAVRTHFDDDDPERPLAIRLHLVRDELITA